MRIRILPATSTSVASLRPIVDTHVDTDGMQKAVEFLIEHGHIIDPGQYFVICGQDGGSHGGSRPPGFYSITLKRPEPRPALVIG